jgi:predicted naringenin-chalcone synthase
VDEILAPGSFDQMTWAPAESAFEMSLSRTVPAEIARGAGALVDRLLAGIDGPATGVLYAVHPGGPRVLESVCDALRLDDAQLAHSRALLRARGNMSSATLPILWDAILRDESVPDGTLIVTLAFGPGLTLAGAVLRVRRPADGA